MKRVLTISLITVVYLTSGMPAFADSTSHRQQVDILFRLTQMEKKIEESVESVLQLQMHQNPKLAQHEAELRKFFSRHMGWTALREEITVMYMNTFTEEELENIKGQIQEISSRGEELIHDIDWEETAHKISGRVKASAFKHEPAKVFSFLFLKKLAPVALGLFLMGFIAGWLIFTGRSGNENLQKRDFNHLPSLDKIEASLNRIEIVDYLRKSQLILTDLMEVNLDHPAAQLQNTFHYENAQMLLRRNRFFKGQLNDPQLLSARNLLYKIEKLLIELVAREKEITEKDLYQLKLFIEREKLLLKIRLIEKELMDQRFPRKKMTDGV